MGETTSGGETTRGETTKGKRLGGKTTRGGNGFGARRPGFLRITLAVGGTYNPNTTTTTLETEGEVGAAGKID